MSQNKSIQTLKPLIQYNKNFIYKGKKYPIDFILITRNSKYFYERLDQYRDIDEIPLTEELIDITEESIPVFILSLHNESFEINDSNVFSLHQLSVKYEVPSLVSLTDDFIKKYDKSLIFKSIQYKYQLQEKNSEEKENSISLEKDEEYIALNLFQYINDDQLLNLPISVLYRIINNPKFDLKKFNENEYIEFLFKCLNKYGREASILFLNLDLENQRIDLFSKLINEYSKIFDFNMISQKFLMKTTTDLLSEMAQLKYNLSNSISQFNEVLKQITDEKKQQQDLFNSFKKFAQEDLEKEKEKINDSLQNVKKQIDEEKQKLQELSDSFNKSTQEQLKNQQDKMNNYFQSLKEQTDEEKQKQQNLTDSFKKLSQDQLKSEQEKVNDTLQNLKKQFDDEKQQQQKLIDSFRQSTQQQLKNEQDQLKSSFQTFKRQVEDENRNTKNEVSRNIDNLKTLVNDNKSKIKYCITRDILIH